MSEVQCEIRSRPVHQGVELVGVVWSDARLSGNYSFTVNKQGPAGTSHTVQRGLFSLEPKVPQILSTISVNTAGGDRYLANLTIASEHDETLCTANLK